jgi:hypothetical protein
LKWIAARSGRVVTHLGQGLAQQPPRLGEAVVVVAHLCEQPQCRGPLLARGTGPEDLLQEPLCPRAVARHEVVLSRFEQPSPAHLGLIHRCRRGRQLTQLGGRVGRAAQPRAGGGLCQRVRDGPARLVRRQSSRT